MRTVRFAAAVSLMMLTSKPASAVSLSLARIVHHVDWTSAGVGGVAGGSGTIMVTGVSGQVKEAILYWHGIHLLQPSDTSTGDFYYDNENVTINGNSVTGTSIGDAGSNCWQSVDSRAFRADVTQFVSGNGAYVIDGLDSREGNSANGASLIIMFDDGNPSNDRDLIIFDGNDSNKNENGPLFFETDGWHAVVTGIDYQGGSVVAQLHVADGQDYPDRPLTFATGASSSLTISDTPFLWDGNSVPSAGVSRQDNGDFWDIHSFNLTSLFGAIGSYSLSVDGQDYFNDCLSLVVLIVDIASPGDVDHLDDFTCYTAGPTKGTVKFRGISNPGVSIADEFGTSVAGVTRPHYLCAPTNKLGEDPAAPMHPEHLIGYFTKDDTKFARHVRVADQFNVGGLFVDVKKPKLLFVPTTKDLIDTPSLPVAFATDHFECYKLRVFPPPTPAPTSGVRLEDQFGSMTVSVKKPAFLCNPVDKNGEYPIAPTHPNHLMCYSIKKTDTTPFMKQVGLFINNQFGPETLDANKPALLCVPALVNVTNGACFCAGNQKEFDVQCTPATFAIDCMGLSQASFCNCPLSGTPTPTPAPTMTPTATPTATPTPTMTATPTPVPTPTGALPSCEATTGGFCWHLGQLGEDCNQTCTAALRAYDPATGTYAGSDGTDAHCMAVMADLLISDPWLGAFDIAGLGCFQGDQPQTGSAVARDTAPTTATASIEGARRACACQ